jgi:hypothetical protein
MVQVREVPPRVNCLPHSVCPNGRGSSQGFSRCFRGRWRRDPEVVDVDDAKLTGGEGALTTPRPPCYRKHETPSQTDQLPSNLP